MKKFFLFFLLFCFTTILFAYTGTTIGPNVSSLDGKNLQWESGSFDYFVMFKSLMENKIRTPCAGADQNNSVGCDLDGNPEADSCLSESSFVLTNQHVPEDAYVEAAYLVWTTSVAPDKINDATDNTATLTFTSSDDSITEVTNAVAPRVGTLGSDANIGIQDFTFEGIALESYGKLIGGYYTYRVDVTDFFASIHEKGREAGYASDGLALYGKYTVSDVECTDDPIYISQTQGYTTYSSTVVCGWSLIIVYRSTKVNAKTVYIYNGFSQYQNQYVNLHISGFEFPDKPTVKMTFSVNEGDPGFAYATGCGGGFGPCPPEGLLVTGATTPPESLVLLENECNPAKTRDSDNQPFNYSETYNSISSIYGWNDSFPTCAGGDPNNPDPDALEYTMDVDAFLLDAETNPAYDEQFKKGDTSMFIQIGANRDVIYTNYMVVSVDTKSPRYDIPINPNTPNGREKNYCSCSENPDTICFTAPFYFMIKVQNWGDDLSTNVTVKDELSSKVSYVPGTTEMCKEWKSENVCNKWIPIEDVNGAFPLAQEYKIADVLDYCDPILQTCSETIMIRFKVLPRPDLAKNEVVENIALINDDSGKVYKTNTSIPLRLTRGNCPSISLCENPDLTDCGGVPSNACESDEECGPGEICSDGVCVIDASNFASNADITVAIGKNSPVNDSPIIVPAPSTQLSMGQFSVIAKTDERGKKFSFASVIASVNSKDFSTILSNIKLIYDANGNGVWDPDEVVVAEPLNGVSANTVAFAFKSENKIYSANTLHYFLMVADATYQDLENVPKNVTFSFSIDDSNSLSFENIENMRLTVADEPIKFVEYSFEPTKKLFVFTKGKNDPPVPPASEINGSSVVVMQIRTKAVNHVNSLKKIKVKTSSKSVKFNEGIKSLSLYTDSDGNASIDGEALIAQTIPDATTSSLDIVLDAPLDYANNEEKILLLVADFNIPKDKMAQFEIQRSKIYLSDKDVDVLGTPIKSKEFWFKCEEDDPANSDLVDAEEDGCSLLIVENLEFGSALAAIFALSALFAALFFSKKRDS